MIADQLLLLTKNPQRRLQRTGPAHVNLAPDTSHGKGLFPNPFKILTHRQTLLVVGLCSIASVTFTLSPVGMTVLVAGLTGLGIREIYHKQTTVLSVMDGITNATYIAETIIPLIAFGLPLSPMALGPAAPLFNAPPRFSVQPVNNLHNQLTTSGFFWCSMLGAVVGLAVSYPFCINSELLTAVQISRKALSG
jgi:hypothetical protein